MGNHTLIKGSPSSQNTWKTVFKEGWNETVLNSHLDTTTAAVVSEAQNEGSYTVLYFIIGIMCVTIFVFAAIGMMVNRRKRKPSSENIEMTDNPQHSINFESLNDENQPPLPAPHSSSSSAAAAPTPKRTKLTSSTSILPRLSEIVQDLFFVIQSTDRASNEQKFTLADVREKEVFEDCGLSLAQRAKLEVGAAVQFIDTDGDYTDGTVIFKGTEAQAEAYHQSLNRPVVVEEEAGGYNDINDGQSAQKIVVLENKVQVLENTVACLQQQQQNFSIELQELKNRLNKVQGTERTPKVSKVIKADKLQTMVNGVVREIIAIPNYITFLTNKINTYRAASNAILCNGQDLRPLLVSNSAFFIAHFSDANSCGLALLYILIGQNNANQAFVSNMFYTQGPRNRGGQLKPCCSFPVTSAFYRGLDFLVANAFVPDHRLNFLTKAREYVNQNVNTVRSHNRGVKEFGIVNPNGPVFDDPFVNFEDERARISQTPEYQSVYDWAASLGTVEEIEEDTEGQLV
uniref:Uncharacterized protein n=1 Tax=Panagrolaimus davidi TaxID=227884 RepID=A0A914Q199_9BILA